ncbi:hypothetical protein BH10PLA1_BH10PLA1_00220 [soil metagenome]
MATAKIDSLDAIKHFRVALIRFAESVNAAMGNADSDVDRAVSWLEGEAKVFWQNEIRKRQLILAQAQEALRMKVLFKNYDGTTPSAVDEKKAVHIAKQRLMIAEQKLEAVRKYTALMQREAVLYKGSSQRFSSTIQSTPVAVAQLSRVLDAIERYMAATPEVAQFVGTGTSQSTAPYLTFLSPITRPEEVEMTKAAAPADVEGNPASPPAAESTLPESAKEAT